MKLKNFVPVCNFNLNYNVNLIHDFIFKEIRRHLRSRRPTNVHSYDSSIESHDGENIGYQSPKHNIHHQRHRGRFNDSWFEDYDENSTGFHRQVHIKLNIFFNIEIIF